MTKRSVSLIVPMLNEADQFPDLEEHLIFWRKSGWQVVLVDGGSSDGSVEMAEAAGCGVMIGAPGRARQMNLGARHSSGQVLVFLHADSRLPETAENLIVEALHDTNRVWGRFDVKIEGESRLLTWVGWLMNRRSRLTGIATGDQAIFVTSEAFYEVGCYPEQPLMEDIELSRRLRRLCPPVCLSAHVTTSGRRWLQKGVMRTIFLMWYLRFAYWCGVSAERLARRYR